MKIAIVGTGYVGLVTAVCLAEIGLDLVCVDIDPKKIDSLKQGIPIIYEPGLEDILLRNIKKGRLSFTSSLASVMQEVDVVFSAVGTPPDEDGSADLQYVLDVARTVGQNMTKYVLLITKSTVPVGTAKKVENTLKKELDSRSLDIPFDIASNPEFLREGSAINDFMNPDRIVCGVNSLKAQEILEAIYKPFTLNGHPIVFTDIASAEMIKYAANAMLATRISFMNDIANLCEIVGADIIAVKKGIGSDTRIGKRFLDAGIGYGGSCFPKDVKALIKTAAQYNYSLEVLKAVEKVNNNQKSVLFDKLSAYFKGNLKNKRIALMGLSFKPDTDDMREAPSLIIIDLLLKAGCTVLAYDPVAMEEAYRRIGNAISYCDNLYETLKNADAMLLLTEWMEFRSLNLHKVKSLMNKAVIFDGRNIYDPKEMEKNNIQYFCIGRNNF